MTKLDKILIKLRLKKQPIFDENAFSQIAFPLGRQVMPTLLASQLVSVQPMQSTGGFHFQYKNPKLALYSGVDNNDRILYEICQYINRS